MLQFLCGPLSLLINVSSLIVFSRLSFYGLFLQTFPMFGLRFSKKLWTDCYLFFKKTSSLLMTMLFFYFMLSYIARFMFSKVPEFSTYRLSIFSMLQIITLDNWGQVVDSIMNTEGVCEKCSIYLVFCIFLMTYFYLNLLTGFMIDIVREKQQERNIRAIKQIYGIEFKPCSQIKVQQF